ncbi:MAG: adenylyltransferase/cytidyltransferase family protein [bacterium]|nr:adenylyltransferase/cytidyltransferase family protein [bacterium]MDA1024600.1 adenylyltransferase/cytidyltransferase family protein [bacterium]
MPTGIFPGTFQPFHTGHLMVIQGMMRACEKVVIVICKNEDVQVFNAEQVREMIGAGLLAADIADAHIKVVQNCDDHEEWVDKLLEAADWPEDAVFWSGREEDLTIFEEAGQMTQKISPVPGHDSNEIRALIEARDYAWRTKVPAGTIDVLEELLSRE